MVGFIRETGLYFLTADAWKWLVDILSVFLWSIFNFEKNA